MTAKPRYRFYDRKPPVVDVRTEVLDGLVARPKRIAPKYFYNESGARLFERITALPEYYLTRTEIGLLEAHRDEIAERVGAGVCLIEYGSGASRKIRLLLERLRPDSYVPVDISNRQLESMAQALCAEFPWLKVYPTCADFTGEFTLPPVIGPAPRVAFFPGSSIGNFEPQDAVDFLARIADLVGSGGRLLIGVDRKKERGILEAAYNDAAGITAEFNRNVLLHLNETLDANFDPAKFEHVALYNDALGCIQMFLESTTEQVVRVAGTRVGFRSGERIHTENSYKYDPDEFTALAGRAGFVCEASWTDSRELFSIFLLRAS